MNSKESGRRRFLKNSAALAGLAVGAIQPAKGQSAGSEKPEERPRDIHTYGERARFENSVRTGAMGLYDAARPGDHRDFGFRTPIQDSVGVITPAALHFRIAHGYEPTDTDPHEHDRLIHSMVRHT